MLKLKNSILNPKLHMIYTLNKLTVSFNFALTVAQIMVEAQTALDKL